MARPPLAQQSQGRETLNPLIIAGIALLCIFLVAFLGWLTGESLRKRSQNGKTLLIGVDKQRGDIELRYVATKNNQLVWGTEKNGSTQHDGTVMPGEGSSMTLHGTGRCFVVNRRTLQTMRFANDGDLVEAAPEDGWQVGMYAVGVHERNIARPAGGTWLDTLAAYTPVILIVVGVVTVIGFVVLGGKIGAG